MPSTFAPQEGQNFAPGSSGAPHCGQKFVRDGAALDGAASGVENSSAGASDAKASFGAAGTFFALFRSTTATTSSAIP